MSLSTGDRLGPYEILSPLGAGGMGEVYTARDTRLGRTVAIKVLPEHIAKREDLRQRFEQEARAVASLNHPNICTLHDIGNQDGTGYMVMEHLDGETLAVRIEKGPLPLDQAIQCAIQIADALDRAHRAGVTHRDVKPGNIILTRDGAKVLDFGLAKAVSKPGPTQATLTAALTTEGTVLGTPQYMAPEQFEGKEADTRCDIWAFGAVLYEMVTGQKAFQGKSYSSLVGAILATEPAPMSMRPFTPSWLERLVRRCLSKDPERRYQSMRDVLLDLEAPPADPPPPQADSRSTRLWQIGTALVTTAFAVASFTLYRATRPTPAPLISLEVDLGVNQPIRGMGGSTIILSPDGRRIAYMDDNSQLWTRSLDETRATLLTRAPPLQGITFSPDGQWIAFAGGGKLSKIMVKGGGVIPIADVGSGLLRGIGWTQDGGILFGDSSRGAIQRISASGGAPTPVTKLDLGRKERAHMWPHVLPGGQAFLFTATTLTTDFDEATIEVWRNESGERKSLVNGGTFASFLPSGHILYARRDALYAVPFDPQRLEVTGAPLPVLDDVLYSAAGYSAFHHSTTGTLVYRRGGQVEQKLHWIDPSGAANPLSAGLVVGNSPWRLSPDGKLVALGENGVIYTYDVDGNRRTRLTFEGNDDDNPVWGPDGSYIVFRHGDQGIWWVPTNGRSKPEPLIKDIGSSIPMSISPDGKTLLALSQKVTHRISLDAASGRPRAAASEVMPQRIGSVVFSPDGRWIAYTDTPGIYVSPWPAFSAKWQIAESGYGPVWSPRNRELLWRSNDGQIKFSSYEVRGAAFVPAEPRSWSPYRSSTVLRFDISPDGARILGPLSNEQDIPNRTAVFLFNFLDELTRKFASAGLQP